MKHVEQIRRRKSALVVTLGGLTVAALGMIAAPACSSSSESDAGAANVPALATDVHTVCVTPGAAAQDVTLPATGGISGTLSFGAFPAGASADCDEVKIATGDDVEPMQTSSASGASRSFTMDDAPKPLLTISVGEGVDSHPIFGQAALVTGMRLNASPNLNFPDGTYSLTVTRTFGGVTHVDVIPVTATGGVLTIAPLMGPAGTTQLPVVLFAGTSAILSLYAPGVNPVASNPTDSTPPTVNVSDAGLPPPGDPPAHGAPQAGAYGFPPPVEGATIGNSLAVWSPGCAGAGCTMMRPITIGNGYGLIDVPAGMAGSVQFAANISYMQLVTASINCPSDWIVSAGLDGSGSITIPSSHPFSGVGCLITYSTLPPGEQGSYYSIVLTLRGLDIGGH